MKSFLDEVIYEMETVFEHGLINSSGFADRFYTFADTMQKMGMQQGSALCKKVADSLNESRFKTTTQHTETFAGFWKYLTLCRDRLAYYHIKADLDSGDIKI